MPKNLLIVESPAKAKTIEKFLGKDYTVKSSYGHVRDLEKNNLSVDVQNDFQPKYMVSPEKKKVVSELKEWVKKSEEVWLATDEDREGEAISWHLCQVLGLDEHNTKRIVFREITKPAIQNAIQQPRKLDLDLVNAQQARRVLDRLVGYELSEVLWKKVKGNLSAGRVQSVAVKLIVEREREIMNFRVQAFYKITATFAVKNGNGKLVELKSELPEKFEKEADALSFLKKCVGAEFKISDIEVKPVKRKPAAPFTTSTLQQEASRKLGFSVNRTMSVAQKLYEAGHISYMRTDSTNLSGEAIHALAEEIEKSYGKAYIRTRQYSNKVANAQEAHEAIRPTYPERRDVSEDRDQQRLYELIWKRTIASQMAEAELERTVVKIGISTMPGNYLQAEGEVLKFDGFLKVYLESKDDDDDDAAKGVLPPLKIGQILDLLEMNGTERFTRAPARYTEASLVKQLEEQGIGRPSTYAPTITKIMEDNRGYVKKDNRPGELRTYRILNLRDSIISQREDSEMVGEVKNRLFPTDMGFIVTDFLEKHFQNIMTYQFTANIEQQFDDISNGGLKWTNMLKGFYGDFHDSVEKTIQEAERASGERLLGKDPSTGRTVLVRMSRLGPVVQIGAQEELPKDEKPRYANLRPGQNMESISFVEALELFQLPKSLGKIEGKEVLVGVGRYGPYVRLGEDFYVSLPKGADPLAVTLEDASHLILQKKSADAPIGTFENQPITKGKGRFGPFIKWGDTYVNVPKKVGFDTISEREAIELIQSKLEKESTRYIQQWQKENISIENGRWGPFIRFKKKFINLPKVDGRKMTNEEAAALSLEEVMKIIREVEPGAFNGKKI
jgi:DNA topoisomerase-1